MNPLASIITMDLTLEPLRFLMKWPRPAVTSFAMALMLVTNFAQASKKTFPHPNPPELPFIEIELQSENGPIPARLIRSSDRSNFSGIGRPSFEQSSPSLWVNGHLFSISKKFTPAAAKDYLAWTIAARETDVLKWKLKQGHLVGDDLKNLVFVPYNLNSLETIGVSGAPTHGHVRLEIINGKLVAIPLEAKGAYDDITHITVVGIEESKASKETLEKIKTAREAHLKVPTGTNKANPSETRGAKKSCSFYFP